MQDNERFFTALRTPISLHHCLYLHPFPSLYTTKAEADENLKKHQRTNRTRHPIESRHLLYSDPHPLSPNLNTPTKR